MQLRNSYTTGSAGTLHNVRGVAVWALLLNGDMNQEVSMESMLFKELLLQSLEHERGGVQVYETALQCVQNEDLKEEWEKYHQQTQRHVEVLEDVFAAMGFDPEEITPGRQIVLDMGQALVAAMEAALDADDPVAAQIVAC